jgi:hypothetical protein
MSNLHHMVDGLLEDLEHNIRMLNIRMPVNARVEITHVGCSARQTQALTAIRSETGRLPKVRIYKCE